MDPRERVRLHVLGKENFGNAFEANQRLRGRFAMGFPVRWFCRLRFRCVHYSLHEISESGRPGSHPPDRGSRLEDPRQGTTEPVPTIIVGSRPVAVVRKLLGLQPLKPSAAEAVEKLINSPSAARLKPYPFTFSTRIS